MSEQKSLNSKSGKELLLRLAMEDKEAFSSIYYEYKDKLYGFAYGLTNSVERSEDLVHDVFLKLWLNRKSAAEIENLNAWLFRSAQNQLIDAVRRFSKSILVFSEYFKTREEVDNSTPVDVLLTKELKEKLEEAVRHLPPQQQKIFFMHREEGLSHSEIAKRLNLSVSTTQNHINRAFAGIRRYLSHTYPDIFVFFLFLL
jgi:RNA polymerase sigma-70 factor (ECF subfamily)